MKVLLIYDSKGKQYMTMMGENIEEPTGAIQSLVVDVPEGQILKGVDVSVTPNKPILENIPKPEIELLKEQVNDLAQANAELTSIVAMGKTNA